MVVGHLGKRKKNFDPVESSVIRIESSTAGIQSLTKSEPSARQFSNGFPKGLKSHASVLEIRVDVLDQPNLPLWLAAIKSRKTLGLR